MAPPRPELGFIWLRQGRNWDSLAYPLRVRRNTVLALIFLLVAITIAGVLGVIRLYQLAG